MESTVRKMGIAIVGIAVLSALVGCADLAQAPPKPEQNELSDLKKEMARLRTEVEGMRADLRQLLSRIRGEEPDPQRANVATTGGATLGSKDAPLTMVEFSDYQCPFCRRFFDQTFPRIKTKYIDTGKVRYVFRDFPLDQIHPQARKAAIAAHCANDQGKYWEAHDMFFKNQEALRPENLKSYAQKLGLKTAAFNECLDKDKYASLVQGNEDDGLKAGVRGTPAFFIGKTTKEGTVDGQLISGARPYEDFQREIDRQLAENRAQ